MARLLDVYLHTDRVGTLTQDDSGAMRFQYARAWLDHPSAVPLSHSLPLRESRFSRKECRGFFGGILPEEEQREIVARNLGISARNDFAMLAEIGGECAGAVTFVPHESPLPTREYGYRPLDDEEMHRVLGELPVHPLLAGEGSVRLSLAGAQSKLSVCFSDGKISIPLNGAPSTHILKPDSKRFPGLVFNEAQCMKLATAVGIPAAGVAIGRVRDLDYLLVERYDRLRTDGGIKRLHQEDFCQALGLPSEQKYQSEDGPSLKTCFELVRQVSRVPVLDVERMLDAVVFNFLIRNADAHGKNFSFLYNGASRLAPMYDLVCTGIYRQIHKRMAMKIGGEYDPDLLHPSHFEKLAEEAGLSKPSTRARVPEMAEKILAALPDATLNHAAAPQVAVFIEASCRKALSRFVTRGV